MISKKIILICLTLCTLIEVGLSKNLRKKTIFLIISMFLTKKYIA